MTRQFFWVAATLALSLPLLVHQNWAVAQQTGTPAEAEAEADTSDASTDTSADASAESSSQAEPQASTSDDAAEAPKPAPSNETQGAKPSLPPPSTQSDPNATQSREQSRVVEGQQPSQQDAATDRSRTDAARNQPDASVRGRANLGERSGRDRENDLRVGIQFGPATDRGLTINRIEQNSFYHRNGFRRGDVIVSVHGRPIRNDADFLRFIITQPGQRVPVMVLRDGRRETIYVQYRDVAYNQPAYGNRQYQAGGAYLGVGFDPQVRDAAVVLSVNPGSPAQEAGLQSGDILVALNGQEIRSYPDAIAIIRAMRPGDELEIIVERARTERQVVALLDTPPSVRTAGRPDVQVERRTIIQQPTQWQDRYEDGRYDDGRLRERDRNYDDGRGRPLLPRLRN
jgi:hypothetical protein